MAKAMRRQTASVPGGLASVSDLLGDRYDDDMQFAFPDVDPGVIPFGSRVLVQTRVAKKKLASGIIVPDTARETDKYNTQVALVRAIGAVAFCDRKTLTPWPEGRWAQPGEFVRIGKWGGDRVEVDYDTGGGVKESIVFCLINDLEIIAAVTGDPLKIKGYI